MKTLCLRDFTTAPSGRLRQHGPHSGEQWRDDHLMPAHRPPVAVGEHLVVDLDGVEGVPALFLDEALAFIPAGTAATHVHVRCTDDLDAESWFG